MTSFVSLSKSMRVKTRVGTPRCGVRSAQRADPTIRAPQAIDSVSWRRAWCRRIRIAICRLFFGGLGLCFAGALTGVVVRLLSGPDAVV